MLARRSCAKSFIATWTRSTLRWSSGDDPGLRGKPVIVAWKGQRSVVCAASYEARAFGVRSAMPAKRAERLCPDAIFIAPDFTRYRDVSSSVREVFKRHTDLIEPLSLDEAYLDVTTNKTGLPTATLVARTIREQIRKELNLTALPEWRPTSSWQNSPRTGKNQMDSL
jgi:DNA polymerase IV